MVKMWFDIFHWLTQENCDLSRTYLVISEWVIAVERQLSNYSDISCREQVIFQWDDDEVRFVLDQHA
jgi:hypothetical protein